ncbi:MAG: lmo0937 family membrane protein [Firmicutes bacterium]|nr:lmo0937 family membrane protein [Bacillota bacterium]
MLKILWVLILILLGLWLLGAIFRIAGGLIHILLVIILVLIIINFLSGVFRRS